MKQKCDYCGGWLEYTDYDNGKDYYVCIDCGAEYSEYVFPLLKEAKDERNQNICTNGKKGN